MSGAWPDRATVVAATDQLSTTFGSEVVILGLRDSIYYGLADVGATIWSRLQQPTTIAALVDAVVSGYDVERDRADADVRALLRELVDRGLVTVDVAGSA